MLMCGGDGFADIFGRKLGKIKLPWNKKKSFAGTFGMFIGGWILAAVILMLYISLGIFSGTFTNYLIPLSVIALAGAIVESLPLQDIDNITVTITALILGHLLF